MARRGRRLRRQDPGPELRPRRSTASGTTRRCSTRRAGAAETWDDFLALCRGDQGRRDRALAHQGKYPYYIQQVIDGHGRQARRQGGRRPRSTTWSRTPGSPVGQDGRRGAATRSSKGYMLQGTEGLDHIQSQTALERGQGRLHPLRLVAGERAEEGRPQGLRHHGRADPAVDGAKLPFEATRVSAAEAFIVPAKAKNVPGGQEYLRIMLSKEGARSSPSSRASPDRRHRRRRGPQAHPGGGVGQRARQGRRGQQLELLLLRLVLAHAAQDRDAPSVSWPPAASRPTSSATACQKAADETAKDPQTKKRTAASRARTAAPALREESDATRTVPVHRGVPGRCPWRCTRSS